MKIHSAGIIFVLFFMPIASHAFCFEEAGAVHEINPELLRGIAKIESGLNSNAVNINSNGSKDLGLMQINSAWIPSIGLDTARLMSDPCYNVMTGARILKMCVERHGYEWKAVGCYNAVSRNKRVDYSWKVYNLLRKTGSGKGSNEKGGDKLRVTSKTIERHAGSAKDTKDYITNVSFPQAKRVGNHSEKKDSGQAGMTNNGSLIYEPVRNSSLSFSVRDTAAVE